MSLILINANLNSLPQARDCMAQILAIAEECEDEEMHLACIKLQEQLPEEIEIRPYSTASLESTGTGFPSRIAGLQAYSSYLWATPPSSAL